MRRYRNHEGYCDPTTGQALENITREERCRRKALLVQEEQKPDKPLPPRYVNKPKNRRRNG
jgi:hypothetical protein